MIIRQTKLFRVVSVSSNANSFGLRGMVLVARDGEAYEVAANSMHLKPKGDDLIIPLNDDGTPDFAGGFELPRKLPAPPRKVLAEIFSDLVGTSFFP